MSAGDVTAPIEVDARGLEGTDLLIYVAKSMRYLSRGTPVDVLTDAVSPDGEFRAWASWAGHRYDGGTLDPAGALAVQFTAYAAPARSSRA